MEEIKIDLKKDNSEAVDLIAKKLKDGSVLILPTDTVYGLSCLASSKKAIDKIYRIKKRLREKKFILLMKSFCMVREYCFLSVAQYKFLKEKIDKKKPLTVVLRSREKLPKYLRRENSVAIRIPARNDFLMNVLKKVNEPIVSTSLNLSGEKELIKEGEIKDFFKRKKILPEIFVNAGNPVTQKPSMIADIRNMRQIVILRK